MPSAIPVYPALSRQPILFVDSKGSQSAIALSDITFKNNQAIYSGPVEGAQAWVSYLARAGRLTPGLAPSQAKAAANAPAADPDAASTAKAAAKDGGSGGDSTG
jgi:hypothetical protein